MELDLKLAKLKSGNATPTSSVYEHFSSLLQRIALKQSEVETQQSYTTLVDEMVTYSTLITQQSCDCNQIHKASTTAHKTLKKMVQY